MAAFPRAGPLRARGRVKLRNRSTIMILASERGSKIEAA